MSQSEINNIITNLLTSMGVEINDIEMYRENDIESDIFNIKTPMARTLIGKRGDVIRAINYIVQKIIEQKMTNSSGVDPKKEDLPNFSIDIDGYQAKIIDDLKTRAKIIADRARSFKRDIALDPMSPYERLIIHSTLKKIPGIDTESLGKGSERHIVVRYNHEELAESQNIPTASASKTGFDRFLV